MFRGARSQQALAIFLIAVSCGLRFLAYPTITSDYVYFLAKWYTALATHPGLTAFESPFTDYAPLYPYLIKLLTFVPGSGLFSIKTLSVLGDVMIALIGARLFMKWGNGTAPRSGLLAFAVLFSLPTLLVNSALWGQSDALYAAPVLASLWYLLKDRPLSATAWFAIALCIKLQAIFFAPVLAGYLLSKRPRAWIVPALAVPLIFAASIVPAWIGGGDFTYWLLSYARQSEEYTWLSVSAQSIFAFANPLPLPGVLVDMLFFLGIASAIVSALLIARAVRQLCLRDSAPEVRARALVFMAFLSGLVLPYLLPRMHERYFFLADVFAALYAVFVPRAWYLAAFTITVSLISYMPFLAPQVPFFSPFYVDLRVGAGALFFVIILALIRAWNAGIFKRADAPS